MAVARLEEVAERLRRQHERMILVGLFLALWIVVVEGRAVLFAAGEICAERGDPFAEDGVVIGVCDDQYAAFDQVVDPFGGIGLHVNDVFVVGDGGGDDVVIAVQFVRQFGQLRVFIFVAFPAELFEMRVEFVFERGVRP